MDGIGRYCCSENYIYLCLTSTLATHYNFIREIPILAQYEVRVSIGTWDQKWVSFILRIS